MNKVKKFDEKYCPECGRPVKREAVICPFCGVQVKKLVKKTDISTIGTDPKITLKKKRTTILFLLDSLYKLF